MLLDHAPPPRERRRADRRDPAGALSDHPDHFVSRANLDRPDELVDASAEHRHRAAPARAARATLANREPAAATRWPRHSAWRHLREHTRPPRARASAFSNTTRSRSTRIHSRRWRASCAASASGVMCGARLRCERRLEPRQVGEARDIDLDRAGEPGGVVAARPLNVREIDRLTVISTHVALTAARPASVLA